jgi:hypothetical protein
MKTSDFNATEETSTIKSTSIETDGIVSVAAGILPPATHQRFIANGSSSNAVFEIVSSRPIVIENAYFSGQYPLIQYITSGDIGVAVNQPSGQMGFTGVGTADKEGLKLLLSVFYNAVDVNTSGSVATLNLTALQYKTDDGIYHAFNPAKIVAAQPMCIVNNVPDILFQNPDDDTLENGYKQIAKIVLTGDTTWKLKALPLGLSSPFLRTISKSKLIIKSKGEKVAVSDVIQLDPNSRIHTIINFDGSFKHYPGEKEILKIYADTPEIGKPGNPIVTNMYPLSSFIWIDGLGIIMPGEKNLLFFKNETGLSVYDEN